MFSELVRKYSRKFLEPLARFISATGVSPNVITVTGTLLMIIVAFVLAKGYFVLGGILITAFAIFDGIDGTLARMMGRTSRFGAFLLGSFYLLHGPKSANGINPHLFHSGWLAHSKLRPRPR